MAKSAGASMSGTTLIPPIVPVLIAMLSKSISVSHPGGLMLPIACSNSLLSRNEEKACGGGGEGSAESARGWRTAAGLTLSIGILGKSGDTSGFRSVGGLLGLVLFRVHLLIWVGEAGEL